MSVGTTDPDQDVLLNMVVTIGTQMAQVFMPPFNFIPYIKDATFVEHATARGPVEYNLLGDSLRNNSSDC
ncbi:MAG: hypothetical protein ACRES5_16640 [Pseudomonas sp.]